jgi:hypothetical protein
VPSMSGKYSQSFILGVCVGVLLTVLDVANMLCPFCLFAVSVILICYVKCLKTVQKSFFVKEKPSIQHSLWKNSWH